MDKKKLWEIKNKEKLLELKNRLVIHKLTKWLTISVIGAALLFAAAYFLKHPMHKTYNDNYAMRQYIGTYLETEEKVTIFQVENRGGLRYAGFQVGEVAQGAPGALGVAVFLRRDLTKDYFPHQMILPADLEEKGKDVSVATTDTHFICISANEMLAEIEMLHTDGTVRYLEVSQCPYMLVLDRFEGEYHFYDRYGAEIVA